MPSDHRLHPSSILFALAGSLRAFLVPAVLLVLTSGRSSPGPSEVGGWGPARWMNRWMPWNFEIANWQFWLLLFLIPAMIAALARYFSFRLRYEGTELVISSGILFRNERHVPYARIQNLDAVRNVAHRLLGVAEVRVETGGGQTPEATISVLHETVFEEMRRRVFEGRAQVAAVEPQPSAAQDSADTGGEPGRRSAPLDGGPGRRSAEVRRRPNAAPPAGSRAVAERTARQPGHGAYRRRRGRPVGGRAARRHFGSGGGWPVSAGPRARHRARAHERRRPRVSRARWHPRDWDCLRARPRPGVVDDLVRRATCTTSTWRESERTSGRNTDC